LLPFPSSGGEGWDKDLYKGIISEMMVKQGHWITAAGSILPFCMMHYRRSVRRGCGMRKLNEEKRRIILREQFID